MDIFYSDSLSRNLTFNCFMFMPEISNRMVFVNGKHPMFFIFAVLLSLGGTAVNFRVAVSKRFPC